MNFENLKIGHVTHIDDGTGLTVFLMGKSAHCGRWLCGSAPATRDVDLLDPASTVAKIDALLFTGGSAYGLGAANGVMQWLREQQRGFPTQHGVVPIVPTAALYDFNINKMAIPTPEDAYQACINAVDNNNLFGRVGAGTGASVGKLLADARSMSGGFGYAQINCPSGLTILACVVVNAIGDIINSQGQIIAGAVNKAGGFINLAQSLQTTLSTHSALAHQNTTLAAVFINAAFDKAQLTRIAKTASAGIARAIDPVFTSHDGDIIFAVSAGEIIADEIIAGALGATAVRTAIMNAVQNSVVL